MTIMTRTITTSDLLIAAHGMYSERGCCSVTAHELAQEVELNTGDDVSDEQARDAARKVLQPGDKPGTFALSLRMPEAY